MFALLMGIVAVWPSWACAQGGRFFCQFDEAQGTVACIKAGESAPSFQFTLENIDLKFLAEIVASARADDHTGMTGERCRVRVEIFREHRIEDNFRISLEGLRTKAEDLRKANLNLYNQVIIVYRGLFNEYWDGIQAYKKAIESCVRITPFQVYPRLSTKPGNDHEHS